MNKNLGILIGENIDLDLFYAVSLDSSKIRAQGKFTKQLENYLFKKGFEKFDWLYAENEDMLEYKKGIVQVLLVK